jgi:ferric-dicitrate binding protein FerR (iron transport regulator)
MSERRENGTVQDRDEQTVARLLRLAGRSEPIADDIEARVYAAVHQEWTASTTRPRGDRVYTEVRRAWDKTPGRARSRFRRIALPVGLAAAVVLAVSVMLRLQPQTPAVPATIVVGSITKTVGPAHGLHVVGQKVYAGDALETGPGSGISITLADAESLRLDADTRLMVVSGDEFELVAGRVYADTGDVLYRDDSLHIVTTAGTVSDIGTQFSVRSEGTLLDVAVREGRVDVATTGGEDLVAVAGERMLLTHGGEPRVEQLAPHDGYWDWVATLAPVYDLENRSLLDFLRWAARESGRELVFEDNELRMAAMRTDLHGAIEDVTPVEAISAVLATTTFRYRIETDRIIIFRD